MKTDFIEKISLYSDFSDNSVETIKEILSFFDENSTVFDEQLSWVINNWKYSKIIDKEEFIDSYPILQFLHNHNGGISLITIINLNYEDVLEVYCNNSFPDFQNYNQNILTDDEISKLWDFHFKFQMAWCAYKWQELNGYLIGYEAFIVTNNSGDEFYLSNLSSDCPANLWEVKNKPVFDDNSNITKLTLYEIYEKVLDIFEN